MNKIYLLTDVLWQSAPMRIGNHEWIVVVFDDYRYGACTQYCFRGPRSPSYLPEEVFVPADRFWPGYNGNDSNGGMPATLRRLYANNQPTIKQMLAEGAQ